MPSQSITGNFAVWLIAAVAALQCPAAGLATESQVSGAEPVAQTQQTYASLPPPSLNQLQPREPFAARAIPVASGDVSDKWRVIQTEIAAESAVLDRCRMEQECPKAVRAFLDIVAEGQARDGLARIGVTNRAVNLAILPTSDEKQWGVADHWSPPLETLATGRGDCEDYAILKYVALIEEGVAKEDVKLVIVHNRLRHEDHAVVAARVDGAWLILDNRSLALAPDDAIGGVTPLFVLDDTGTKILAPAAGRGIS